MHVRPVLKRKKSFSFIKEKKMGKLDMDAGNLAPAKVEQVKQDARIYATGNKVGIKNLWLTLRRTCFASSLAKETFF